MARYIKPAPVLYSALRVWGAACAAQRINGSYVKDPQYKYEDGKEPELTVPANKHLMREILESENDPRLTQQDLDDGEACRTHYQGLIFKEIAGTLNSGFLKAVYALSAKEDFLSNAYIELAQLAAAPQGWRRDSVREANIEKASFGKYLGNVGDKITGDVVVTESNYSKNYGIFFVHGFVDSNAVFFAHKAGFTPGATVAIKGTVKSQRDNFTTQLNRVKEVK